LSTGIHISFSYQKNQKEMGNPYDKIK